jgi:biopolymer transport protein ExbD/biopolymer transport protein TolR
MVNVPSPHHQIGIDLAKSNHSIFLRQAIREDAMRVSLLPDGKLYFGNSNISPDDLPGQIHERIGNGAEEKVYLAVDSRAKYGRVATVVDQLRLAGVRDIALITE